MKSKLVGTLAVLMALGNIAYCIPLPAHAGESQASSEAGLYAPTVPRGRRRGRYRGYNQQPQQQSTYLTSTGAPMTPGPSPQGQGRRNGNGQRRGQHPQIRNYGGGRGKRQQQNGGNGGGGNQNGVQNTGIPVQSTLPGNPTTHTSTP